MDSFYGGRQGRTYNIVARFPDISAMTSAFAQSTYTAVNFGQYVMIDTINEPDNYPGTWTPRWTDRQNGAIYRRGFDITNTIAPDSTTIVNPGNGAIYVGQIPSGQPGDSIENVRVDEGTNQLLYDIRHWDMNSSESSVSSTTAGTITALTNIEFVTENFLNPSFETTYSGTHTPQSFTNINYPVKIGLSGDNLTVLYANEDYRENHLDNPIIGEGSLKWENLGAVTAQFHIYGNCSDLTEIQDTYPKGLGYEWDSVQSKWILTTPEIQGWLITTTSSIGEGSSAVTNYNCYAYNYRNGSIATETTDVSKQRWYLMGDFKTAVTAQQMSNYIQPEKIMAIGTTAQQSAIASTLNNGGYWFVKE